MRPLFNLPGRSAIDCMASWLGDGSVGILLTSKQYEEKFYTQREAAVVGTTFSAVSITFSLVVIAQVELEHLFLPFYGAVCLAGLVAAVVIPRLPPLSWKKILISMAANLILMPMRSQKVTARFLGHGAGFNQSGKKLNPSNR